MILTPAWHLVGAVAEVRAHDRDPAARCEEPDGAFSRGGRRTEAPRHDQIEGPPQIDVPRELTREQREAVDALSQAMNGNPRETLLRQAKVS